METISSSEVAAGEAARYAVSNPSGGDTARFTMWPLPDLRLAVHREYEVEETTDDEQHAAYERGYGEGLAAAEQQTRSELADALRALKSLCQRVNELHRRKEGENERIVHALAVAVAEQIIQREISLDPTLVKEFVRNAVADVSEKGRLSVRMHPDDLTVIEACPEWQSIETQGLCWVEDATITRGGCVVEAANHTVDGRIEAILKHMFQRLNDV